MSSPSSSTSPLPNPEGKYIINPKLLGQSSIVRQDLSQYATTKVGIQIVAADGNVDPETIHVTIYQKSDFSDNMEDPLGPGLIIAQGDLDHEEVGVYSFILDPSFTSLLSLLTVKWEYTVSGNTYTYMDYFEIREPMPLFDSLTEGEKDIVRQVIFRFEDLYDSVEGGPYLKEPFQTHFGTETVARCLRLAVNKINMTAQPYSSYIVGDAIGTRLPANAYSVVEFATYIQVIKHLMRSYVEMPTMEGSPGVSFYDRSNYLDRWRSILKDEGDDLDKAIVSFKRSLLGLGGGSLIVSGGIYGNISSWRSGMYSAQARAARFMYPTSVVQVMPGSY